jgi:hypothetical protein
LKEPENRGAAHPCFRVTLSMWLLEPVERCVTSVLNIDENFSQ